MPGLAFTLAACVRRAKGWAAGKASGRPTVHLGMARSRSPSLRLALLLNHVPIWLFSASLLLGAPFVFLLYERHVDGLRAALQAGELSPAALEALSV